MIFHTAHCIDMFVCVCHTVSLLSHSDFLDDNIWSGQSIFNFIYTDFPTL